MVTGTLAICLAIQLSATGANYTPIKIGFVDRDQLFETPGVEKRLTPIRATIKESETEFEQRWEDLLAQFRNFEVNKEFMDEEDRKAREAELKGLRDDLLQFAQSKQEAIEEERDKVMREIVDEIRNMVRQVAQERGYALVLWKSALAYGAPEHDLTRHVLKVLLAREGEQP